MQNSDFSDFLWLEEVESPNALAWAEGHNKHTFSRMKTDPRFNPLQESILALLNAEDRIQYGTQRDDGYVYNFQKTAEHVRGIWRRCTLEDYLNFSQTGTFNWQTLLDVDALAEAEGENWVFKNFDHSPNGKRALVGLSRGGADATVVREFCMETLEFLPDGFYLPEAKNTICWEADDTLLAATDHGEGSLTTSGLPRTVVRLKRGQNLAESTVVHECEREHVVVAPGRCKLPEGDVCIIVEKRTRYAGRTLIANKAGGFDPLDVPEDVELEGIRYDQVLLSLRHPWQVNGETYPQGSLVLLTPDNGHTELFWTPTESTVLDGVTRVKGGFLLTVMENVTDRVIYMTCDNGTWRQTPVPLPEKGILGVQNTSARRTDFMFTYANSVTPTALYHYDLKTGEQTELQTLPDRFDADGMTLSQFFATSADGTKIPYFVMHKEDLPLDGSSPTLMTGYGGFENPVQPGYSALYGRHWVSEGGVFVIANIRGGGEFGPRWHQAALKHNRQRCYDDFIAVAEDLISRGITSPPRLGIEGGSNGGLLVGATMTQRPDLFRAVICAVPLLDMLRYHFLHAGASWMGEYGDPDNPEDRAVIERYSPFQNLQPDAGYPEPFFWTNTRDDRVHPGHARRMVARMEEMGHPVLYYENTEGGHGGGADNTQLATTLALEFIYLKQKLMD